MLLESKEPVIECVFLVSSQIVKRIISARFPPRPIFNMYSVTETRPGNYFCFSAWYLFCLAVEVLSVVSKVIYLSHIIRNVCGDDLQADIQYSQISYLKKERNKDLSTF